MAVDHWWLGTTSVDHAVAANWSTAGSGGAPGASVPGTGNEVMFDGNGNNPCTLSANLALLHLDVVVGYTAKLDLATFNLTMDDGGNVTLDGGGEFDKGSGTISLTNGIWDVVDQVAWDRGTSTVTFAGTSTINTGTTNVFENLTIVSGTTTVSTNHTFASDAVVINGTLSVDSGMDLYVGNNATCVLGASGRITGAGDLQLYRLASGKGITTFPGTATIDVSVIRIPQPNAAARLVAGNYQSVVKVYNDSSTTDYTLTLDAAGVYQFNEFELETTGTNALTLDNTNGPTSITINGDLTSDKDSTGTITVNDSGVGTNWIVTGDVLNQGAATWTKGTGTITAQASPYLKNGAGFSFNGSSDEVDINAQVHNFATDFTIAAWVRVPSVTSATTRMIFSQGATCQLFLNSNGGLGYWTGGDGTAGGTLTSNTWHHVMVTYDTSGTNEIVLYIDNATDPAWDEDKNGTNTAVDSRIGSKLGTSEWFDGHIADVRVFNKALSTAERAELHNSGDGTTAVVAGSNDVGWYKLDESAADTTVVDTTGNNNGTSIQNTNVLRASYDQDWDWGAMTGTIEGAVINKPLGTLTLSGALATDSFTGTSTGAGKFDPNGQTITTTGNCAWAAAFVFDTAADCLNGSTWTIGGNFTADGQTLNAAAGWDLDVTGTAVASGAGAVAYSTAGVTPITASAGPWTDSGNNSGWRFGHPIMRRWGGVPFMAAGPVLQGRGW